MKTSLPTLSLDWEPTHRDNFSPGNSWNHTVTLNVDTRGWCLVKER